MAVLLAEAQGKAAADGIEGFERTMIFTLNPKSITMNQLYGSFDLSTGEWTDGIGADLFRHCAAPDPECGVTEALRGRKVALSFSNKTADAAFAKALDALLKEAGCESRMIAKWPVAGWVQGCVWAADEADFVLVLHSANYDEVASSDAASSHARLALTNTARAPPRALATAVHRRATSPSLSAFW